MDLSYTAEDERFRAEFRGWLDGNLPRRVAAPRLLGGACRDDAFRCAASGRRRRRVPAGRASSGRVEFGGRGGTPAQKSIYDEEMARARAP